MTKILSLAAVIGLLVAASSTADARGGGGYGGASGFAPGQSFRAFGAVADIRVRLVSRRAICGEYMAACPVIPALRVSHRDIDLCIIEDDA